MRYLLACFLHTPSRPMNRTGNPDFHKIRNRDNTALNAKKAETANVKALAVYDRLAKLQDDPHTRARVKTLLADGQKESLTLKGLCAVLQNLGVPAPSGGEEAKWHPTSVKRLRDQVLALKGIDILRFWSE